MVKRPSGADAHKTDVVAQSGEEDSLRESSALVQHHANALSHPLSHDELVRLQRRAPPAGGTLGLVRSRHCLARRKDRQAGAARDVL